MSDAITLRLLARAVRLGNAATVAQAGGYPDLARRLAGQSDDCLRQADLLPTKEDQCSSRSPKPTWPPKVI